jgi:hypothetical protein
VASHQFAADVARSLHGEAAQNTGGGISSRSSNFSYVGRAMLKGLQPKMSLLLRYYWRRAKRGFASRVTTLFRRGD